MHGRRAKPLVVLLVASLLAPLCAASCKRGKGAPDAGPEEPLVLRRVPDAPLVMAVPKSWSIEIPDVPPLLQPDAGPAPAEAADGGAAAVDGGARTGVEAAAAAYPMRTRTLLVARPPEPREGSLVRPMLMVLHDPWLPKGTTAVDYLVAQRASNQAAVGSIQHVDAEPSRRDGRPAYHVRDEWSVDGPGGMQAKVAQEALLLLDSDGAWLHGYAVVLTMEKRDLPAYERDLRRVLESVRFKDAPAATPPSKK